VPGIIEILVETIRNQRYQFNHNLKSHVDI